MLYGVDGLITCARLALTCARLALVDALYERAIFCLDFVVISEEKLEIAGKTQSMWILSNYRYQINRP